jgi:predicted transposase/invertase (TIGR01784 family)
MDRTGETDFLLQVEAGGGTDRGRGAVNTLYRISEDPKVRAQMEYREKARHDHATLLYAAVQEGEARGEARSRVEIARNMKKRGRSIDQIAEDTGLSAEEIAKL